MKFTITDPIDLEPLIPKVVTTTINRIGWNVKFLSKSIKFSQSLPVRATTILSFEISNPITEQKCNFNVNCQNISELNFTPQIQVLDLPIIIRSTKIRLNHLKPIVFNPKSTGWKYHKTIPLYVLIMTLVNTLLYKVPNLDLSSPTISKDQLRRINLTPELPTSSKATEVVLPAESIKDELIPLLLEFVKQQKLEEQYPGIDKIIKDEIIDPLLSHIERGEAVIKSLENPDSDDGTIEITAAMRREVYDRDIYRWLGKYITRRNEAKVGRRHITEMLYGYLLDIFNSPYYDHENLIAQILIALYKYNKQEFMDENDWSKKRFRLREYLLQPILEELVKLATAGLRKTVNLKLTKYWYESGLFVYNSIVNPLALLSLQSRCTIKGPGALIYPTKQHRSVHDSMQGLVDSISTGEREQAGVVHMVLSPILDELRGLEQYATTNN